MSIETLDGPAASGSAASTLSQGEVVDSVVHVSDRHADHADWQIFLDKDRRPVRCRGIFRKEDSMAHAQGTRAHLKHIRDGLRATAENMLASGIAAEQENARHLFSGLDEVSIDKVVRSDGGNYPVVNVTGRVVCSNFAKFLLSRQAERPELRIDLMDNGTSLPASRFSSLIIGDEEMEVLTPSCEAVNIKLALAKEKLDELPPDDGTLLHQRQWRTTQINQMAVTFNAPDHVCRVAKLLCLNHLIPENELERVQKEAAHVMAAGDKNPMLDIFVEPQETARLIDFLAGCKPARSPGSGFHR